MVLDGNNLEQIQTTALSWCFCTALRKHDTPKDGEQVLGCDTASVSRVRETGFPDEDQPGSFLFSFSFKFGG